MLFDPPPEWVLSERRRVGDRVRLLREARDLTQEQLSERCGLDRKTINRVEQGSHSTAIDRYIMIAGGLGVPLSALFEPPTYQRDDMP